MTTLVSSPHDWGRHRVQQVMLQVLFALIPGIAAMFWYFGWGVLINIALASASAVAAEALMLRLRKRPLQPAVTDFSAVVTAVLFALSVPPTLPWWMTVLGILFAIVIVKQLYGGLGYNPFNPAMAAYVLLLISYPAAMTHWLPPSVLSKETIDLFDSLRIIFSGAPPAGGWDAITMATPLDQMRNGLGQDMMISEIRESPVWGDFGAKGWEWVANWYALGGLWLLYKRVISWRIPVAMILSLIVIAALFSLANPESYPNPLFHVFSGGVMLGAFFIATDPVTASTTPRGQLVYGALIGVLVYIIRTWGGYPDGIAFAVLLMNMAAPTIDYYTRPRVFGHREDGHE